MSNSKLYVGNLSFDLDENAIRSEFEKCGTVTDVYVATDKFTGRPRGFAFVTMGSPEEAKTAIEQLNNQEIAGRALSVSEARPKESGGGFGGGGGGGGRKFGGGGGGGGGGRREGSYGGRRDGGRGRY